MQSRRVSVVPLVGGRRSAGFSLVEIITVLLVIALLASIVVVAMSGLRSRSRDSKRLSDVNQLRLALEAYFNRESSYPTSGAVQPGKPLVSPDGRKTYMKAVPQYPLPADGDCSGYGSYKYQPYGSAYVINYCLGEDNEDIKAGRCQATPDGVCLPCVSDCMAAQRCSGELDNCGDPCPGNYPATVSAVSGLSQVTVSWSAVPGATSYKLYGSLASPSGYNDVLYSGTDLSYTVTGLNVSWWYTYAVSAVTCGSEGPKSPTVSAIASVNACNAPGRLTECTGANNYGDICGGGYLYCKGDADCGGVNLVAAPALEADGDCLYYSPVYSDGLVRAWDNDGVAEAAPYLATNAYDGFANLNGNSVPTIANYNPASKYAAARFCADLNINGFDDWYLPADAELCALIRSGKYCQSITTACVAGLGQASSTAALHGCTNSAPLVLQTINQVYWPSTDYISGSARYFHGSTGARGSSSKSNTYRVRCVRRF